MFFCFTILGFVTAQSQEIVNAGFENWQTITVFERPAQWHSWPTPYYQPSNMEMLESDVQDGTFAAKLITIAYEDGQNTETEPSVMLHAEEPGEGIENTVPLDVGVEFDEVVFFAKYDILPDDAGAGIVVGYDGETAVGQGLSIFEGTQSEWKEFSLSLPQVANKLTLAFLSSTYPGMFEGVDNTMQAGSWLAIDNVSLLKDGQLVATQLPNSSFETWEKRELEKPDGWTVGDLWRLAEREDIGVFKTEDAFTGTYAVELHVFEHDGSAEESTLHYGDGTWEDGGVAIDGRPMQLSGMYKYDAVGPDQASISVEMLQNGAQIGGNWVNLPGTGGNYEPFAIALNYDSEDVDPDKIFIRFMAGNNVGSVLKFDDLAFADKYQVTIHVTESESNNPVGGAQVDVEGIDHSVWTNEIGEATFMVADGTHDYTVAAYGYNTGEGNFIVDGQDIGVDVGLTKFEPDDTEPTVRIMDMDHDKVYFASDEFKVEITLPSSLPIPNGTPITDVLEGIYTEEGNLVRLAVFQEGTVVASNIQNNVFTISGTIGEVTQTGVIALGTIIGGNESELLPIIDTYQYNGDISDYGMALVGVAIPADNITSDPEFPDIESLYNTWNNISFYKEGHGSVTFEPGLNIIDNREQLNALGVGLNIVAGEMGEQFYAEIDPQSLSFLSNRRAIITLNNIPDGVTSEDIKVVTTFFGQEASEDDMEANLSDMIEPELVDGSYSFAVHGFSRYSLLMGTATALDDNISQDIMLYPNPFTGVINFNKPGLVERVMISNMAGTVVLDNKPKGAASINAESLSPGFYVVTIIDVKGNRSVYSMVKQ